MSAYDNWNELKKLLWISFDESVENHDEADEHYLKIIRAMEGMEAPSIKTRNNVIHDCYYDIHDAVPNKSKIEEIADKLPKRIKLLADVWGWDDTEVRDSVYEWIGGNAHEYS